MKTEYVNVRKELLDRLQTELVGPEKEEEIIKIKPLQKYLTGILWPQNSALAWGEDEANQAEGKETNKEILEMNTPLSKALNPSAVGMSFLIEKKSPKVNLEITFGMYKKIGTDEAEDWQRIPYKFFKKIDFSEETGKRHHFPHPEKHNITVEWLVRPFMDTLSVSLFLVNRYKQEVDEFDIDFKCVFQPCITITSIKSPAFAVRQAFTHGKNTYKDSDTKSNDLLYKDDTVFAVGHNISVKWENVTGNAQNAGKLQTNIIPSYEIPMVIPPEWNKGGTLDMKQLSTFTSGEEYYKALSPLCKEYKLWIAEREKEITSITEESIKITAKQHIKNCKKSLYRMENGLKLVKDDPIVFQAFRFANKAMALQRTHSIYASTGTPPENVEAKWRPFQIAFILQNLEGTINPLSDDRNIADLLWFPTGGGKTEAYLGLAAFTMGYRRLNNSENYRTDTGVSVIMRYTLRLLTIQQFQRASALICACESLRRKDPDLFGSIPFRIGLWVGEKSAPNNFDDAYSTIQNLNQIALSKGDTFIDKSKGSPIQLVSCPWCGESLYDENNPRALRKAYRAVQHKRRVLVSCPNKECEFHINGNTEGIPIIVTDEEIYRLLPDMIIGTVDKFAQMPWKAEVQNLFGKIKGEVKGWGFISNGNDPKELNKVESVAGTNTVSNNQKLHPPNLIIQDELHLISGPLGTMVGLYETAVDYLSSITINGKRIGPKVVASTATIRNAENQIKGIFNREAQVFPSPGLSHKDSFFAQQRPLDETPGRLYVGLFAPGRSMKTALVRTYANLLSSTTAMVDYFPAKNVDPYHTLVGYFNSLRELGGAVRLIEDDVSGRMRTLENLNDAEKSYRYKYRDYEKNIPELTSRIDSGEIPQILKKLEQPFYKKGNVPTVDVLLASNMISVGVDVSRLGLMVVNGQPKTTSEYIQSTSRVGRRDPGLVITVYNWVRPRDISHYEEFYTYHSAIYRYVEPISVTPFSSRARDRGLAGTVIAMSRLGHSELTPKEAPKEIRENPSIIEDIQSIIINRVKQMDSSSDGVTQELQKLFDTWDEAIEKSKLLYCYDYKKENMNLIYPLGMKKNGYFKTPNSMRDVEGTAGIYLGRD